MPARRSAAALTRPRLPVSGRLDHGLFLRPIAHRGLHVPTGPRIENTAAAFLAAIDKGYGIECDLQPASDGTPMVFHDERLERLVAASGPIAAHTPAQLARLRYRRHDASILRFAEFLELVAGRVPLLVEIKANGREPLPGFPRPDRAPGQVLQRADRPHVLQPRDRRRGRAARSHHPARSGGRQPQAAALVVGSAQSRQQGPHPHAHAGLGADGLAFFAVDVRMLASARAWIARHTPELALFSWTIRTARERRSAARWADAPIFEGYEA